MKIIPQILFKQYLEPGEEVLDICHRHVFIITENLLRSLFFGFLIPLFIWYLFPGSTIFVVPWLFISFIKLIYTVLIWYYDALLITNVSLNKTLWNGFFARSSTRLEYPMIEGLTYHIMGFRRTVFNYGLVTIERAGGAASIQFPDAMNPQKVERLVLHYQEKFVSDQNLKDSKSLQNLLVTMLRHHSKTKGAGTQQHSVNEKRP